MRGGEPVLMAGRVRYALVLAIVAALAATGLAACSKPSPYSQRVDGWVICAGGRFQIGEAGGGKQSLTYP